MTMPAIAHTPPRGSVLVVDDEAALRFPIVEVLRDIGVTVIEAGNADEALECLRVEPLIQLVFSDVRMPGTMDGIELARTIEARGDGITVMLTSGNVPSQTSPFRLIIPKPYNLARVAGQIVKGLEYPRAMGPAPTLFPTH